MGNNCHCIGKSNNDDICKTNSSNGSTRIQAYPNNRKIFDDQFSGRRFTLEPIKSSAAAVPIRSDSTKRSANIYNPDNFSTATEALTYQSDHNAITYSIFQSSPPRRQSEYSSCAQSNCSPMNSNKKRVSKIFSNPQSTAVQTPNTSRRQTFHENITQSHSSNKHNLQLNGDYLAAPVNIEKAEWSLSPVISPRSKFFARNTAVPLQKSFDGVQCDISEVIDFKQQEQSEQHDHKSNKSSFSTNVFELDFQQNSELEMAFKELENKQKNRVNNFARITELTLEDEEEDSNSQRGKDMKLYTSTIREQTSLTYSDSSICNISSLTPEQMQIVKSKYYQFESSNSDKSTQIFDNSQSYNYAGNKIVHSRDQIFSPQRLSTVRASDSILSETIKRNSNPKNSEKLILA